MEPTSTPTIDELIDAVSRRIRDEAADPTSDGGSVLRLTHALDALESIARTRAGLT